MYNSVNLGSEIFQTSVMKTEEVLLFVKAAVENGSSIEEANEDMRMVDDILNIKRIHMVVHGEIKRTRSGHLRKGTSLYDSIEAIINSRSKENIKKNE
jgi:hypothetical protein